MQASDNAWYALTTRIGRERHVSTLLGLREFEVFLPCHRTRHRWSDRFKESETPFFPGYLFCHFDVSNKLPILIVPGVISIVGIGRKPIPIAQDEIESLRSVVRSGLPAQSCSFVEVGQRVHLHDGPLRGSSGTIVESAPEKNRLVVSVTLLKRSIAVNIDPAWIWTT